jgi:soluble lytic murein transglycosylase
MLGAFGQEVAAETIYRFVDENGVIHFSNVPADPRYKKFRMDRPSVRLKPTVPSKALNQATAQTITKASLRHQLDPALVRAVIKAESGFNPRAVSPKGAIGLMQLMPQTALFLNVSNPYDPEQNISGGVRYLRYLVDLFQGDIHLALAAYNAGETRVLRESRIPPIRETQEYVRRVLRFYQEFSGENEPAPLVTRRFINYLSP